MGFFSSLDIEGYDRQYTDKQLVSRAAEYFRPYTLQLVTVTLLLLVIALASAATPLESFVILLNLVIPIEIIYSCSFLG